MSNKRPHPDDSAERKPSKLSFDFSGSTPAVSFFAPRPSSLFAPQAKKQKTHPDNLAEKKPSTPSFGSSASTPQVSGSASKSSSSFGTPQPKKQKTIHDDLEHGKSLTAGLLNRMESHRYGGEFNTPLPLDRKEFNAVMLGLGGLKSNLNQMEEKLAAVTKPYEPFINAQIINEVETAIKCIKDLNGSGTCSIVVYQVINGEARVRAEIAAQVKEKMKNSVADDLATHIKDQVRLAFAEFMRQKYVEDTRLLDASLQKAQDGRN